MTIGINQWSLINSQFSSLRVGTRGFEPPTTRTPSVCATRLRYVPIELTLGFPLEQSQDLAQFIPYAQQHTVAFGPFGDFRPRQMLPGAGDSEAAFVKKAFDLQDHFDIPFAVNAV